MNERKNNLSYETWNFRNIYKLYRIMADSNTKHPLLHIYNTPLCQLLFLQCYDILAIYDFHCMDEIYDNLILNNQTHQRWPPEYLKNQDFQVHRFKVPVPRVDQSLFRSDNIRIRRCTWDLKIHILLLHHKLSVHGRSCNLVSCWNSCVILLS